MPKLAHVQCRWSGATFVSPIQIPEAAMATMTLEGNTKTCRVCHQATPVEKGDIRFLEGDGPVHPERR